MVSKQQTQARKVGLGRFRGEYLYEAAQELRCAMCQGVIAPGTVFTRMGVEVGGGVSSAGSGLVNACPSCQRVPDRAGPSPVELPEYAATVPTQTVLMVRARMGRRANRALGLLGFLQARADQDDGWVDETELLGLLASKRSTLTLLLFDLAADGLVERQMVPRAWLSAGPGSWPSLQAGPRWRAADGDRRVALLTLRENLELQPAQELVDLCEQAVTAGRTGMACPELPDRETVARVHAQTAGLRYDRDGHSSRGTSLAVGVRLQQWLQAMWQAGRHATGV